MEMSGEYRIPAPRARVWESLNDPNVLKQAIPGCQELNKVSDTEMTAVVQAKVGMVRATFNGAVTLSNLDPPKSYTISGEGKGGVAGFAKGGADVSLEEEGPNATLLRYTARGQVGGKLAQIGARLIDATAKQMADQFFAKFAEIVGGNAAPAASAPAAAAAEGEGAFAKVEHAVEHAVEEAAHTVSEVAHEAEEEVEKAAVTGFLGGPQIWGLLALIVVIVIILVVFR